MVGGGDISLQRYLLMHESIIKKNALLVDGFGWETGTRVQE